LNAAAWRRLRGANYTVPVQAGSRAVAVILPITMSDTVSPLTEAMRFRVLRLLEKNPNTSYRAISRELGVSLGSVHYCLKALVGKGLVKIENFKASDHKWHYAYIVTPKGVAIRAKLTNEFLQRKMVEYEALKAEIAAIQQELSS